MITQGQIDIMQAEIIRKLGEQFQYMDVKSIVVQKYNNLKQQGYTDDEALINAFERDLIWNWEVGY